MPFLLSVSFCFTPLLRARDGEAAAANRAGTVCGAAPRCPVAPGGGHRSRPRAPAAALQRSPQPRCAAVNTRAAPGRCVGSAERRGGLRIGRQVRRGRLSTGARCWLGGRRGGAGTASLAPRAGGPGSASAPGRGQPPAPRPCARPSRGGGRQSSAGSAGGCASHRPRLCFPFFPACSGPRRPGLGPAAVRRSPRPIWAPAGAGAGSRWRASLASPGRRLRQRRSRGLGLASKPARARSQRPLRRGRGCRAPARGRPGAQRVPLDADRGQACCSAGGSRYSACAGLRGQLAAPGRGCQGRNPVPRENTPLPLRGACGGARGRRDPRALGAYRALPGCLTLSRSVRAFCSLPARKEAAASSSVAEISQGTRGPVAFLPRHSSAGAARGEGLRGHPPGHPGLAAGWRPCCAPGFQGLARTGGRWGRWCGRGAPLLGGRRRGAAANGVAARRRFRGRSALCAGACGAELRPRGREERSEPKPYTNTAATGGERPDGAAGSPGAASADGTRPRLTPLPPVAMRPLARDL